MAAYQVEIHNTNSVRTNVFIRYSEYQPPHTFVVPAGETRVFAVGQPHLIEPGRTIKERIKPQGFPWGFVLAHSSVKNIPVLPEELLHPLAEGGVVLQVRVPGQDRPGGVLGLV